MLCSNLDRHLRKYDHQLGTIARQQAMAHFSTGLDSRPVKMETLGTL